MAKKAFLVMICLMSTIFFASTLHAQSARKTLTLPNGEVVVDLNGEWDAYVENYGPQPWGNYPQLVKVTQTGSSFVGIRMISGPWNPIGSEQVQGELDKNGIIKVQMKNVLGAVDAKGTVSEDGNKMVIDNGVNSKVTYTRK